MSNNIDLASFASTPKSKAKTHAGDARVVQFDRILQMFNNQGVRLSYESSNLILNRLGLVSDKAVNVATAGIRFLNQPEVTVPWTVCNTKGLYDEKAIKQWGERAPKGFGQRPIVGKDRMTRDLLDQLVAESARSMGAPEVTEEAAEPAEPTTEAEPVTEQPEATAEPAPEAPAKSGRRRKVAGSN